MCLLELINKSELYEGWKRGIYWILIGKLLRLLEYTIE